MRVLLIDDDARLAELLVGYLDPQGVALVHAGGGQAGLAQVATGGFDAILLDVMMPGMDGLAVLRKLRDAGHRVPVLMLTARGDEADRVVGLELGADDYIAKPFSPRELLARLRAVFDARRPMRLPKSDRGGDHGRHGRARSVGRWCACRAHRLGDRSVDRAVRRAGRVVPRSALLELAGRGDVAVGERAVDVHISRLRKKLGDDAATRIRTVRGVGYMLARTAEES